MDENYVKELEEKLAHYEEQQPEIPKVHFVSGETKDGFRFTINENAGDDYELLEAVIDSEDGNPIAVLKMYKKILGDEQHQRLKDFVKDKYGYVSTSKMDEIVSEILLMVPALKN